MNNFQQEIKALEFDTFLGRSLDQDFQIATLAMQNMSVAIINSGVPEFNEIVKSYNRAIESIKNNNRSYDDLLMEKLVINNYYHFEEFISKCYITIYKYFPKYLLSEEITVNFEDLFEQNDISFVRNRIINKKVKSIVQSSNVYTLIKKLDTIFSIKIGLEKNRLDQLFVISQKRNVIIHNRGIINGIYLNELRKYSIEPELAEGEYVLRRISDKEIKEMFLYIFEIIQLITEKIIADYSRLTKHHEKITS
jgi:hypothetical protein